MQKFSNKTRKVVFGLKTSKIFHSAGELPTDVVPFDATSSLPVEDQKETAMMNIQKCLRNQEAARALALLRASR